MPRLVRNSSVRIAKATRQLGLWGSHRAACPMCVCRRLVNTADVFDGTGDQRPLLRQYTSYIVSTGVMPAAFRRAAVLPYAVNPSPSGNHGES